MNFPVKAGVRGWLVLGGVIVACDLLDDRTLSEAFLTFSRTPAGRAATILGWGILTAHLFGLIPARLDPIRLLADHVPGRKSDPVFIRRCPQHGDVIEFAGQRRTCISCQEQRGNPS